MLCRLCSAPELWFDHLRIAENGADDVVEVMRNSACHRSDHLHAARSFKTSRESRSVALEKLALEGTGHKVAGKAQHGQRENSVRCRPAGIETHDASYPARSDQRHAGPAADASGCEYVLQCPGRQSGSIRHGGDTGADRGEMCGQCQRLFGPAGWIRRSISGPYMYSGGVLI